MTKSNGTTKDHKKPRRTRKIVWKSMSWRVVCVYGIMCLAGVQFSLVLTKFAYLKLSPDVWRLEHSEGQRLRISGLEKFYGNRDIVCRVEEYRWSWYGGPGLIRPKVTLRDIALLEPGAESTGDGAERPVAHSGDAGYQVEERSTMYLDEGDLLGMQVSFIGVPDWPLDSSPYEPLAFIWHTIVSAGLALLAFLWIIKMRMTFWGQQVSHGDSDTAKNP